tara:strand:+ start:12050 stop:12844 length:795 start_codon:yes stop_codon:yes gene_type:complete
MKGLEGKMAIVTGGGAGIGRACMERLCEEGVSVTFSDNELDNSKKTEMELLKKGYNVHFVHGDMSDMIFCKKVVDETIRKWGRLDFLVNNAFSFIAKGLDATKEDWDRIMNVGPIAYAHMAKFAAPHMKKTGGAIVNISSVSAHIAQPNRWTYNAAKGAVAQLTRCMAMDLAPEIRVNSVSPGWIWTREVEKAADNDRGKWAPIWGKFHLLRRLGTVEEIAAPTAFLLSDEASFISGADLFVDGGYLAMGSEGLGESTRLAGSN